MLEACPAHTDNISETYQNHASNKPKPCPKTCPKPVQNSWKSMHMAGSHFFVVPEQALRAHTPASNDTFYWA